MALTADRTERDLARLDELIAQKEAEFLATPARSPRRSWTARARSLAGGVISNWQISKPQPIWITHGKGSHIWDVDGNEYVDLHNGYGVMAVGHAHPKIVEAVSDADHAGIALRAADPGFDRRGRGARSAGGACRCGGSATPAPSRPWTPST